MYFTSFMFIFDLHNYLFHSLFILLHSMLHLILRFRIYLEIFSACRKGSNGYSFALSLCVYCACGSDNILGARSVDAQQN